MSEQQPAAVCSCGYPLLEGQTCPECGQPFAVAGEPESGSDGAVALGLAVASAVCLVLAFGSAGVFEASFTGHGGDGAALAAALLFFVIGGLAGACGAVIAVSRWFRGDDDRKVRWALIAGGINAVAYGGLLSLFMAFQ